MGVCFSWSNTTDVAFAEHAPTLRSGTTRPDGTLVSGGVYGQVRIDFADFNNAVFENDSARQSFSLGIIVLHEFVHGLYPQERAGGLSDHRGGGAGEIENNWINPIREELGLPTRDVYSATFISQYEASRFSLQREQGVKLSFTHYIDLTPDGADSSVERHMVPVTTNVYWQLNTVGGRRR